MNKAEPVLKNETHDFKIQTDHLITVRPPDQVKKEKNLSNIGLYPNGPKSENKRKRKER